MSYASEHPVFCAHRAQGCTASHPGSRFDAMKADREGWFHSKAEETAYCPAHIPDWVPAWRARQAAWKFEVDGTFTRLPAALQCQGCSFADTVEDPDSDEQVKDLRAQGFEHARKTGHTVSVGSAQVLVIEVVKEKADA